MNLMKDKFTKISANPKQNKPQQMPPHIPDKLLKVNQTLTSHQKQDPKIADMCRRWARNKYGGGSGADTII